MYHNSTISLDQSFRYGLRCICNHFPLSEQPTDVWTKTLPNRNELSSKSSHFLKNCPLSRLMLFQGEFYFCKQTITEPKKASMCQIHMRPKYDGVDRYHFATFEISSGKVELSRKFRHLKLGPFLCDQTF